MLNKHNFNQNNIKSQCANEYNITDKHTSTTTK